MQKLSGWSDQKIIDYLSTGGKSREKAIDHIMKQFIHYVPSVAKKTGLTREDALDTFSDAIIILLDKVAKGEFKGESKLSSYFYKIFYFKSVDLFRKNTTNKIDYRTELPDLTDQEPLATQNIETDEAINLLYQFMDRLGEPCKQILLDWGFWGYNMTEIAERAGLEGSKQAKDRKYSCLQKLRKLMA